MKLQIIINISILIWGTFINVKDTNHLYEISDFDQMDYYLFCDTAINEEVTDIVHVYEEGLYAPVLEEYRRVIENTAYVEADWKYVYDYVKRYIGESSEYLYYSTKDLINDGTPELILGIKEDEEYRPFIIYTYNNGKIEWLCISEEYLMTIYKGGIVEYITGGVRTHFMYDQLEKSTNETKRLENIVIEALEEEAYKYYRSNKSNEYEEITEEEFLNIRSHYTAEKEVLDWKKVKEF